MSCFSCCFVLVAVTNNQAVVIVLMPSDRHPSHQRSSLLHLSWEALINETSLFLQYKDRRHARKLLHMWPEQDSAIIEAFRDSSSSESMSSPKCPTTMQTSCALRSYPEQCDVTTSPTAYVPSNVVLQLLHGRWHNHPPHWQGFCWYCIYRLVSGLGVLKSVFALHSMSSSDPASWRPPVSEKDIMMERGLMNGLVATAGLYGTPYPRLYQFFLQYLNLSSGLFVGLYVQTFRHLYLSLRSSHDSSPSYRKLRIFLLTYITIFFILGTLYIISDARVNQFIFIDDRNYPGGPIAFTTEQYSIPLNVLTNVSHILGTWFADALIVRSLFFSDWLLFKKWTLARPCHRSLPLFSLVLDTHFAFSYVCRFYRWVASSHWLIHMPLNGALGCSIALMIQVTRPKSSLWTSLDFSLPYFILSLALNVILPALLVFRICFLRLRMISLMGRHEGEKYISVSAIIVESATLVSVFSLLFLVTYALDYWIQVVWLQVMAMIQVRASFKNWSSTDRFFCLILKLIAPLLIIYQVARGCAWCPTSAAESNIISTVITLDPSSELELDRYVEEGTKREINSLFIGA